MHRLPIQIASRLLRLVGNLCKVLSYGVHALAPRWRLTIPSHAPARLRRPATGPIPRVIWQTNYSNRVTLPVYLNYLFNRCMSLDCEYRYVSTEAREVFLREHAPAEVYAAYLRLTDGAAQADLWRVTQLHHSGGVYLDIDAALVWPLRSLLKGVDPALYIQSRHTHEITNYFLATTPGNPHFRQVMARIVQYIEHYDPRRGVYGTTGPVVFNEILAGAEIECRQRQLVCVQGAFSNEYFQYMDKPRGKWTHQDPKDLIRPSDSSSSPLNRSKP
jgi:mannosyltransferase OCH1-like enzyme